MHAGHDEVTDFTADKRSFLLALTETTAVLCVTSGLAVSMLRYCSLYGLSVPGDLAVTGINDHELYKDVSPSLTTVRIPVIEDARVCIGTFISLLEGKQKRIELESKPSLVVRKSVSRPSSLGK
jgi:LacI family transcriptional regulator